MNEKHTLFYPVLSCIVFDVQVKGNTAFVKTNKADGSGKFRSFLP